MLISYVCGAVDMISKRFSSAVGALAMIGFMHSASTNPAGMIASMVHSAVLSCTSNDLMCWINLLEPTVFFSELSLLMWTNF